MTEARGLIIGYGNTLRGDDAVGCYVANVLAHRLDFARVKVCPQLTVELADDVARAPWVIFVDADAEEPAGKLRVEPLDPDKYLPRMFTHHVPPASLLTCAQQLFGSAPPAWLFAIGVESTEPGLEVTLDSTTVQKIASEITH